MKLRRVLSLLMLVTLSTALSVWAVVLYPSWVVFAQTPPASPMGPVADVRVFYERLSLYGEWVVLEPHGWVWVPLSVSFGWRPYTNGRWVYTEAGLTWVSEWRWGWATFHYGRWLFTAQSGWSWVPDTVWAPAWVAWQLGPGWIGWAPLPPQVSWDAQVGLSAERIDLVNIEPLNYVFVATRQLLQPDLQKYVVSPARHSTLLSLTRNITAYTPGKERVHNRSLSIEQVAQLVGHPVSPYQLQDMASGSAQLNTQVQGKDIVMFRPRLHKPGPGDAFSPVEHPPLLIAPSPQERQSLQPSVKHRELEDRLAAERARLLARQELESEQLVAQGRTLEEVRQQQERERRLFELYAERERRMLDNRLKRARRRMRLRLQYDEQDPWRSLYE